MTIEPRAVGRSSVHTSPITLGTMRISERDYSDDHWVALFGRAVELGITTFHISKEYESHARFAALLRRFRTRDLTFIAKVAAPHFGETRFSKDLLEARVDEYLRDLNIDRVDVLQWMWRGDLKHEQTRLDGVHEQHAELAAAFDALRAKGKIGCVAPFPYTVGFAEAMIETGICDGLTVYLNPLEQEMAPFVERAREKTMSILALRPFAAAKALEASPPARCIASVLQHSSVCTAIASCSTFEHLAALEQTARRCNESIGVPV